MPAKRVVLLDIGILATATRQRGIGRYVTELGRGLVSIAREWDDLEIVFLESVGLDGSSQVCRSLEPAIARLASGEPCVRYRWSYPLRLFAGRAVERCGARLLHLPAPGATPLGLAGAASVVTCHDLIPYRYPEHYAGLEDGFRWGRRALDRRRYHSASHVIAVSQATAKDLKRFLGLGPDRVSTVLSGIDAQRWNGADRCSDAAQLQELGLAGRRFVVYVGDADWRKNGEGMLRALADVRRSDTTLELVWLGRPSSAARDRARRAEAVACGVEKACHFMGYVSDAALRAVYRAALATLLVSRAEGFGYPVLEAMAAGCPVITSNTSSLPEVAGDAALQVDPECPEALAGAIALLAHDPAQRKDLITRGAKRALDFSLTAQARGTLAVYRSLLEERFDKPSGLA